MEKNIKPIQTKTAKQVIKLIEQHLKEQSSFKIDYTRWYCGVTNNPSSRKSNHKAKTKHEPYFWIHYYCRSKNISLAIEKYYHDKGMLETDQKGNVQEDSYYFYVYKKYPTIVD